MNIGDRVLIGGRTMLRPGFSLVGLEAIVMPTFPNAPAGCATVQIDWEGAGYDEEKYDDLPPFINVPIAHLEIVTPPETTKTELTTPILGLVDHRVLDVESDMTVDEAPLNQTPQHDSTPDDSQQPRLRLI